MAGRSMSSHQSSKIWRRYAGKQHRSNQTKKYGGRRR